MSEAGSQVLHEALKFAVDCHYGMNRDGETPVPYACHPIEVMTNLRYGLDIRDENVLAAAMLHDTVEDTDATIEEIEGKFGKRVAELVQQVTREEPSESETAGKSKEEVWALRTAMMIEEIKEMEPAAMQIKLSDRLSNVREALQTRSGRKLDRYLKQTVYILQTIPRDVAPILWDATAAFLEMEAADILQSEPFSANEF